MVPGTQIVAAVDVNEKTLADFVRRWEIPASYTDYREMLDREKLDIVSILTPNFFHCEMTVAAAQVGVPVVFCEVPMCASLAEADTMIETCEKEGTQLVVCLGSGRWWSQEFIRAKEIIDSGGIGELVTMVTTFTGGVVLNGTSMIDMLRFFADAEVTEVWGWLYDLPPADSEFIDRGGTGFLRFANGVEALVNGRDGKPGVLEWDIMGSEGRIRISSYVLELWKTDRNRGHGQPVLCPFPESYVPRSPRVATIEQIVAYLRGGQASISNGSHGRAAMEIALAFHKSHSTGDWVKLPLKDLKLEAKVLHGPRAWH